MTNKTKNIRPPIVTVMGHIDHGKTTLLDKIRGASVASREAGGITQHVAAYQVTIKRKDGEKVITFIDTPGHAAFSAMRSRGAKLTDMVVLVIAATDGIMAQTKESIAHIKAADLPVIVAMNKMDLDTASAEKVKGQLVEAELTPEEYGGQVACIPVSAKTGKGIDELIDRILLQAEVMELESEPDAPILATVVESRLDKNRGPIASVIVQKGFLHLSDQVYAENVFCKVKALTDSSGKNITSAGPSTPVEILGFESVPAVGALLTPNKIDHVVITTSKKFVPIGEETPKLKIIVKADVNGSLEALLNSLSDDVDIVSSGIGAVSDNDIFRAQAADAQIYAFNVKVPPTVSKLADNEKVKIFPSRIIYEILEDIEKRVLKLLEPTIDEDVLGEAKVIAEFKINGTRIAGISITKGEMTKGDLIHLKRDNKITKDTKIEGIHQAKEIVEKVKVGHECGITFRPYVDFKLNDVIISYKKKE